MKKVIIFLFAFSLILTGCVSQPAEKTEKDIAIENAQQQIDNSLNYQPNLDELDKVVRLEEGLAYYYASDNKRYTFPDETSFKSWFPKTDLNEVKIADLETLYETSLGGNVPLRPGSLIMTETDPKIYMITNNIEMKIFGNSTLLETLYGQDYQNLITDIPNKFFTQYNITGAINQPQDIPQIPLDLTIDQNLN
jgi:hypothetical protein